VLGPHGYGPAVTEGFGLLQFNVLVRCKSHQLTQFVVPVLLFWRVLVGGLPRFGAVVQAGKEHVNRSFFRG